ncbi:MAG: LCP family protein [Anaerolineales bacterium]|jgi:LCP family protein required for cell wall assembly|nr:LCP family protein [Anaerolineales bacterium]
MRTTHLIVIFFSLILTACGAPTPQAYSAYYFVSAAQDATATATPFQPEAASATPQLVRQTGQPSATITLPAPAATITPLPTSTEIPLQPTLALVETPAIPIDAPDSLVYLLLGSDLRPGSSYRTDTILVAVIRPKDGQVSLISFPRDLWVTIPTVGLQRINTAYQFGELNQYPGGGPGLLKDTILTNFGLEIQQTAMVDFDGFRRIVDTLGGVDVPIACPYTDWRLISPDYNPEYEDNWWLYTAGPGLIHMDGDLALWYARSRMRSNDFDRGRRQQEVLRAVYKQTLSTNTLSSLPELYTQLNASIQTDVGLRDVISLAPLAFRMNNADIRSYYIAGDLVTSWITPGGAYVLLPNTEAIQAMLSEALSPSALQEERQIFSIEVQNGSSYDGWETLAAERLNYGGYKTTTAPADHRQHAATLLYDLSPDQNPARAASLLAVLGLGEQALVAVPDSKDKLDYILVVGNDYQPCFKPAELTP